MSETPRRLAPQPREAGQRGASMPTPPPPTPHVRCRVQSKALILSLVRPTARVPEYNWDLEGQGYI